MYFCATFFNETLFSFLFVLMPYLMVRAGHSSERRSLRFAAAGGLLGRYWPREAPGDSPLDSSSSR